MPLTRNVMPRWACHIRDGEHPTFCPNCTATFTHAVRARLRACAHRALLRPGQAALVAGEELCIPRHPRGRASSVVHDEETLDLVLLEGEGLALPGRAFDSESESRARAPGPAAECSCARRPRTAGCRVLAGVARRRGRRDVEDVRCVSILLRRPPSRRASD